MSSLSRSSRLPSNRQNICVYVKGMKKAIEAFENSLDKAPIENPLAIGTVQNVCAPLRLEKLCTSKNRKTIEQCLMLVAFAMSCKVAPAWSVVLE